MRPAQTRQFTIWYNANRRRDNSVRPNATAPTSRRPYRYCSRKMAVTGRASINCLTFAARALKAANPGVSRRPRSARPVVNQHRCPSQAPVEAASQTPMGLSTPCSDNVAATMRMSSPSIRLPPNTASRPYLETRATTEAVGTGSTIPGNPRVRGDVGGGRSAGPGGEEPGDRGDERDHAGCAGEARVEIGVADRDGHAHRPRHGNRFGDDVLELRPREAPGLRVVTGGEGVSPKARRGPCAAPTAGPRPGGGVPGARTERAPMASRSRRSRAPTPTTSSAAIRGSSCVQLGGSRHRQTPREAELHVCGLARRRQHRRVRVLVPVHEEQTEAPMAVASAREAAEQQGAVAPDDDGQAAIGEDAPHR